MSTLLQTLFCASGRVSTLTTITGATAVDTANTAAGTHDASDSTTDRLAQTGDFDTQPPHGTDRVEWVLDTASAAGTIDFVRVKHRSRVTAVFGIFTGSKSRPSINGTSRGVNNELSPTTFTNYQDDFTTDPDDAAAWTNAKINAKKFGVFLEIVGNDQDADGYVDAAEITVEVWGTAVTDNLSTRFVQAGPVNSFSGG